MKHFLTKCDQICSFLWFWKHLVKKSLMENFVFLEFEFELVTGKKGYLHTFAYKTFSDFAFTAFSRGGNNGVG